jgi:AcrR family transcriptional regulator
MAQVKKPAVRDAILSAAYRLFRDQGYNGTTLSEIAQQAGVSTANLYSYFRSKFDILYCIYDPWLHDRFRRLEQELNGIRDPKRCLRHLIAVLWRDIPAEANNFSNNIIQAVSGAGPDEKYDASLLRVAEQLTGKLLTEMLPPERLEVVDVKTLAHIMFMAFDGFAMSAHANPNACCTNREINLLCSLVLGDTDRPSRSGKRASESSKNGRGMVSAT